MKTVVIGIALAIAVGAGLVYFGVFSKGNVESQTRKAFYEGKKAAGQVAKAFEVNENVKDPVAAKKCRENMQRMESAKRAVAQSKGLAVGTVSWDDVLRHMNLTKRPVCPSGGQYQLNSLSQVVTCSIGGNQTTNQSDDHSIQGF